MNRMRKKRGRGSTGFICVTLSSILILCLAVELSEVESAEEIAKREPTVNPVAKPHKDLSCEDCHIVHGAKLLVDTGQSCITCHEDQVGDDSHPTNVPHTGEPPAGLPLSKEGHITCYTCHVLHETKSPVARLLRKKFDVLCMTCHFPGETPDTGSQDKE